MIVTRVLTFPMTELASVYSQPTNCARKAEFTLKKKKQIPPPKYLCVPGSLAFVDRISIVDKSNSLCSEIRCLFQNNDIDLEVETLYVPQNNPDCTDIQSEIGFEGKSLKIGKSRRLLKKETKHEWLKVSNCRIFWSHILMGANEIIRCLENSVHNKNNRDTQEKRISCVFVDSGWLTSQYGHHLANLCTLLDIRIVAVKPTGSLPELVTTKFKPIKKLAVLGLCSSNEIPPDLFKVCKQIEIDFPIVGHNTGNISAVMATNVHEASYKTSNNHSEVSLLVEKKGGWEDVEISSALYDYDSPPHEFTITEFQSYLSSIVLQSFESRIVHDMLDSDNQSDFEYSNNFCAYRPPLLKRVAPRMERKSRKQKRSASQSIKINDSAYPVNVQPPISVGKKTNRSTGDKVKREEVLPIIG
ncbi:unnamed protein product [Schistosoma turkestanicum]|nr:unnamed protein product [Schistosoma turkestanicum]